ncbi:hypothetical protein Y695_02378 [Hydrogenophaga sp. T4]|nr:hypothetical protein Y695_02378 [Hydrogenophaga sp. T4]
MRGSVTVCMVSLTTMPLFTCRRMLSASAVLGRMPTAITSRSAGSSVPSLKRIAFTRPPLPSSWSPTSSCVCAPMRNFMPRSSSEACSILPATSSS